MDGYALSSSSTSEASSSNPVTYRVIGSIAAGDPPLRPTETARDLTCYEIMTGAPFPLGNAYDACIRHESVITPETSTGQTNITRSSEKDHPFPQAKYITINSPVPSRANRKLAGEDFKIGDMLGPKGQAVTAGGIMALASTGLQEVEVSRRSSERKRLRIGVLTTGKEVNHPNAMNSSRNLDPDLCGNLTTVTPATLEEGHIFNSNGPYLRGILESWGHNVISIDPPKEDTAEAFQKVLKEAIDRIETTSQNGLLTPPPDSNMFRSSLDLVITTGGVSAGKHDYVPSSILDLGGKIIFHKTTIRPGFPVLFGELPRKVPIFGLPGNPIAVAACLRFLVGEFIAGNKHSSRMPAFARLLSSDFKSDSVRAQGPGCGASVSSAQEHRARYHKKPLATRCFLPSRLHRTRPRTAGEDNESSLGLDIIPWVEPLTRSASLTSAMGEADCWVVLPEGKEVFEEGDVVRIVDMDL
jgi:molybdopterin molybdotransferase